MDNNLVEKFKKELPQVIQMRSEIADYLNNGTNTSKEFKDRLIEFDSKLSNIEYRMTTYLETGVDPYAEDN